MSDDVASFLLLEAQLLDEWRLQEWLDLFAEDGIYWLPIDEASEPLDYPSITYDDKASLEVRVAQLTRHGRRASQTPRSETIHLISNLRIESAPDGLAEARYNCLVAESRPGDWRQRGIGEQRLLAARYQFKLAFEGGLMKIREKKVVLLDRRQPIEPLTVLI